LSVSAAVPNGQYEIIQPFRVVVVVVAVVEMIATVALY